jgi:hypothetical protein
VVARGVLYAVTPDHEAEMLRRAGDQEALVEYLDNLWDEDWQFETDKAWDEMHRTLGDGELNTEVSTPLSAVILGGRQLSVEDWFIIVHKDARQVGAIAAAAEGSSDDEFRESYLSRQPLFDGPLLGWGDALCMFKQIKWFYRRAADAGRAVIFAVDQ